MNLTIRNIISEISRVQDTFSAFAKGLQADAAVIRKSCIVIDEVLSNIINHGFEDQREHQIKVSAEVIENVVRLRFVDDGVQFNPLLVEDPSSGNGSPGQAGGLGIRLMKILVDDIKYDRRGQENHLTINIRLH